MTKYTVGFASFDNTLCPQTSFYMFGKYAIYLKLWVLCFANMVPS